MAFVRASWPSSEGARLFGPPRAKRGQGQYKSRSPADPQPGRLLLIRICSSQDVQDIEALTPRFERKVLRKTRCGLASSSFGISRNTRMYAWAVRSEPRSSKKARYPTRHALPAP